MLSFRYFFNRPPISTPALRISGMGIQEKMPAAMVDRPHGTGDYLLMVFFDDVTFTAKDGTQTHPAGTLILWPPTSGHFYGNTARPWLHSWVHCDGRLIDAMIQQTGMPVNTAITLSDPYVCDKYILDLHIELTGRAAPDPAIARNILENWMREIVRMRRGPHLARLPGPVAAARAFIESHFTEPLTLDQIADHADVSVPHLCSLFRKHCGASVMAYVIGLRLAKAQLLIQDTVLPIGQVARAVGYDDLFHFSKLFKKHFGVPPTKMRP